MTGKIKAKAIDEGKQQKNEEQEYIIIGSNNYWYASGLTSLAEAKEEIKEIQKHPEQHTPSELPEIFYIYKVTEAERIYN